jgi:protein TonB
MTRIGEFTTFLGLAAALHVGLFMNFGPTGAQSQGATGQASVMLMASSSEMAERVAAWSRPVELVQQVPELPAATDAPTQQFETDTAPATTRATRDAPVIQRRPQPAPAVAALPQTPPQFDADTPKPDILRHAPKTSLRPVSRPVPQPKPATVESQPKSQKATAGSQKQTASGGQTGQNAGGTQATQSASISQAKRTSLMAQWGASIRTGIERRKRYPAGTSASGTAVLRITLSRAGRLLGVSVVRSSGTGKLDQAAVRAVQSAGFRAAPKGLTAAQYKFNLPVAFQRN